MNKELEEDKKTLEVFNLAGKIEIITQQEFEDVKKAIATVLQALENSIPKQIVENKLKELDKEEQEAQDSISDEEKEEYSDASVGYLLADIETRRRCYKELMEGK